MATLCLFCALITAALGASPAVPAGLDGKQWVTNGDDRVVMIHRAQATHTCTYPNDNATRDDVKAQVLTMARSGLSYIPCDGCTGELGYFCARNNAPNDLLSCQVSYIDEDCQKLPSNPDCQHMTWSLGEANAQWNYFDIDQGRETPEHCSKLQPGRWCHTYVGRFQHGQCDPETCKPTQGSVVTCKWESGPETIHAEVVYYTLQTSASEIAMSV
mmetsp:Transcript_65654/g.125195  ORF Transcript_65654/g.125195 Transcript_65654/m.125195 type:complete len:215 (+) Transcript_65654:91-735(+)